MLNLEKRVETLSLSLSKKKVANVKAQVGVALDISGSMLHLYTSEVMQEYINRILPVALKFDDNGVIDTWIFNQRSTKIPSITSDNIDDYIYNNVISKVGGGTEYATTLEDVYKHYFFKRNLLFRLVKKTGYITFMVYI